MSGATDTEPDLSVQGSSLAVATSTYFDNLSRTVWMASLMVVICQIGMCACYVGGSFFLLAAIERTRCQCHMIPRVEAKTGDVTQHVTVEDPTLPLAEKILRARGEIP